MSDLILYGIPGSTYLRTVQIACEIKGLSYVIKPLEFRQASHAALHPFLRMPVMQHGELILFESLAIASYVEDLVPEPALLPSDPTTKAKALQWISAYIDYMAKVFIHGKPENEGDNWPELAGHYLDILDNQFRQTPFLCGDAPCLADTYLSPCIDYALKASGFDEMLAKREHLMQWWEKASSCPVFEKTQVE